MSLKQILIERASSPYTMVDFHFWALVLWCLITPPAMIWLASSVAWVSAISIYAIIVGHMSALSSAQTEKVVQEKVVDNGGPPTPDGHQS